MPAPKRKFREKGFVRDDGVIVMPRRLTDGVASVLRGREVFVTVEDAAGIRTPNQQGYYFAAIVEPLTDHFTDMGERFTTDDVHEILKYRSLLVTVYDEETGEVKTQYVRSTSSLKVYEFAFYLDDCIQYCAELGLTIDPPKFRRKDYIFPIFARDNEKRERYIARIREYVADIFSVDNLSRFWKQNDEWRNDDDVRAVFTERKLQLMTIQ